MFHSLLRDVQTKSDLPPFVFDQYAVYILPWENDDVIKNLGNLSLKNDLETVLYYQSNETHTDLIGTFSLLLGDGKKTLFGILQLDKVNRFLNCFFGFDITVFSAFIHYKFGIQGDMLCIAVLEIYKQMITRPNNFKYFHTKTAAYLLNNNSRSWEELAETLKINFKRHDAEFLTNLAKYTVLLRDGFSHFTNNIHIVF